jgi:CHAD domain-containing protein
MRTKVVTARISLEREIKLSISPRFRIPDLPGQVLPRRLLTSIYYDAPDFRLARAGITLRRRLEMRKSVWQLKLPRPGARLEVEFPAGRPDPPAKLTDLLFVHLRSQTVQVVATLRTRRSGVRVQGPQGPVADVLLDSVSVLENGRTLRWFRELEVELADRDEAVLHQLGGTLRAAGAGDHDGRPKLFRALGLELPQPEAPLPASAPAAEHLETMLRAQQAAILAHDPGVRLGSEPEELHQMRVATRRARALLRAARPMLDPAWVAGLRDELAWMGGVLGPVRDRDVLVNRFRRESATLEPDERRAFGRLLARLEAERDTARAEMMAALTSDRYLKLLDRLGEAAAAPAIVAPDISLRDLAAAEFKKLRKAVRALPLEPSNQQLHAVRIRCKRARYAAELAEIASGKSATRFIKRARAFQDLLGDHQDAVVAEERLRQLVEAARGKEVALAAGRIMERERARRAGARAAFKKLWTKLNKQGRAAWG